MEIFISQPQASSRKTIKVIFEFSILRPKHVIYRGVQAAEGGYRMEKRGPNAKKFKPFMYCGSIEGLLWQKKVILQTPKSSLNYP